MKTIDDLVHDAETESSVLRSVSHMTPIAACEFLLALVIKIRRSSDTETASTRETSRIADRPEEQETPTPTPIWYTPPKTEPDRETRDRIAALVSTTTEWDRDSVEIQKNDEDWAQEVAPTIPLVRTPVSTSPTLTLLPKIPTSKCETILQILRDRGPMTETQLKTEFGRLVNDESARQRKNTGSLLYHLISSGQIARRGELIEIPSTQSTSQPLTSERAPG